MDADFNNIINLIKTNNKINVEIKDFHTGSEIIKANDRLNGTKIFEKYGTIEDYFAILKDQGYNKIQVQLFEQRGSANVRKGIAYNFELASKEEEKTFLEKQSPTPNNLPVPNASLQGLGMPGLGMPELINLNVDRHMLGHTKTELEFEKTERKRLEEENKELKEKVRTIENKKENVEMWTSFGKELISGLSGFASMMKPGLNGPQEEVYEGMKGSLIQVIKNTPSITEQQGMSAYHVLNAYAENNQALVQEIEQLLKKHQTNGENNNN